MRPENLTEGKMSLSPDSTLQTQVPNTDYAGWLDVVDIGELIREDRDSSSRAVSHIQRTWVSLKTRSIVWKAMLTV